MSAEPVSYTPRKGTAMSDDTYNGWTNRETWALMLWIDNDEGLQSMAHEVIRNNADQDAGTREEAFRYWVESILTRSGYEAEFGEPWPGNLADVAEDVGSLWRINWHEAIKSIRTDLASE